MIFSAKELFYCAYLLGVERIIGVEYLFPYQSGMFDKELNETKLRLRERKLLRQTSKGEVILNKEIIRIIIALSEPKDVLNITSTAVLFKGNDAMFVVEKAQDEYSITIYNEEKDANLYINKLLTEAK